MKFHLMPSLPKMPGASFLRCWNNGCASLPFTSLFAKSGMIHSLTLANGYIIVDEFSEGYDKGSIVRVHRLGD